MITITDDMLKKIIGTYEENKENLGHIERSIEDNGMLDNGISEVEETFEMGYNNALEYIFNTIGIDYEPFYSTDEKSVEL